MVIVDTLYVIIQVANLGKFVDKSKYSRQNSFLQEEGEAEPSMRIIANGDLTTME